MVTKPSPSQQTEALRTEFLAAQAAAQHIITTTPVLPHGIEARRSLGEVVLQIYFHDSIGNVFRFGRHFGAEVTTRRHTKKPDSDLYTSAVGAINGVRFEAWTLTDPADEAHSAEQHHRFEEDPATEAACAALAPGYREARTPAVAS